MMANGMHPLGGLERALTNGMNPLGVPYLHYIRCLPRAMRRQSNLSRGFKYKLRFT